MSVTNVEILGGDANVICVSKKIKHIFDFNVKIKFSLSIDESMRLPPAAEVTSYRVDQWGACVYIYAQLFKLEIMNL